MLNPYLLVLRQSSVIPKVFAASMSNLKFFLTPNKALFAFKYALTISGLH